MPVITRSMTRNLEPEVPPVVASSATHSQPEVAFPTTNSRKRKVTPKATSHVPKSSKKSKKRTVEEEVEPDTVEEVAEEEQCIGSHPLLNSFILSMIFEFLPVEDLKSARRVCTVWMAETTKSMGKIGWTSVKAGRVTETADRLYRLHKFIEKFEQNAIISKRFSLSSLTFTSTYHRVLTAFWDSCGPWMTALTLSSVSLSGKSVSIFQNAIYNGVPNLQSLTWGNVKMWIGSGELEQLHSSVIPADVQNELVSLSVVIGKDKLPFTWIRIFTRFPRLQNLVLRMGYFTHIHEVLNAIKEVQQSGQKVIVNDLSIEYYDDRSCYQDTSSHFLQQLFHEVQLPLKTLRLNTYVFHKPEYRISTVDFNFSDLLNKFMHTLETLDIYYMTHPLNFARTSVMSRLQHVTINTCSYPQAPHEINLHFLKFTPRLKSLSISDNCYGYGPLVMLNTARKPYECVPSSLSKFSHYWSGTQYLPQDWHFENAICNSLLRSMSWISNITILEMPLRDSTFQLVCRYWRNSTKLTVLQHQSKLTDVGITGIFENGANNAVVLSNITNLRHLKSLDLQNWCSELSDKSIFHGFLKVPELRYLKINAPVSTFSEEAVTQLVEHVRNVVL